VGIWSTTSVQTVNSGDGRNWAQATQLTPSIAIQATATGTLNTDYISVGNNGAAQNVAASGTDIIFDTNIASSGIGYSTSTGVFTLTAGKTYRITSEIAFQQYSANGYLLVQLVDGSSNTAINTQVVSYPYNSGFNEVNNPVSDIIYTPTTNQTVKFRITGGSSGLTAQQRGGGFSRAVIQQIANTFSLTAISGLTTTGDINVGGNLGVTGNTIVTGGIRKSARVLTTTTTLTIADASGFIEFTPGSGPYTITLPNPTLAANSGIGYRFWQNTTDNITLSTPGGAFYGPSGSGISTVVLVQATTQYWDVWSDGFNWAVFGIKMA
jgi:hypothetical protein